MQYRAHLPPPLSNVKQDAFSPLRPRVSVGYSYRALAHGNIVIPNRPPVPAAFIFEYDIHPQHAGGFLKQLNPEDFGIPNPNYRLFFIKPVALYGAGWFLKGVHKLPGFKGMDVFFSTVPPNHEGSPWWGEYYDPTLESLYNPPPEHAFAEDYRSYTYSGDTDEPRVCCPGLIPSRVWERLRFFIRFFDTVYILKPTEYARRRYYRFVEEELPAIMRALQGLSWLQPVDAPKDVIGMPTTDTSVFLNITLGEGYYSAWRLVGEGVAGIGDEIIPPPNYLPEPLQEGVQAAHLNAGRWRWSPNSGYWPPPTPPTWYDVDGFTVNKTGYSLLHLMQFYNYDWDAESDWMRNIKENGAGDKIFASYSTGYYDSQGNWIMPAFVSAVPPILIVNSTSGDLLIWGLDDEERDGENITKVYLRGVDRRTGRYGPYEYKVRFALTTTIRIGITPLRRLREGAKFYAPPPPEFIRKTFSPYFELEDVFTYPLNKFMEPHKRKLQFAPRDVNRFDKLSVPSGITASGGEEILDGISFHVATLPTGESSNVITIVDENSGLSFNSFVDNISVQLGETRCGAQIRSWLEEHLMPAFNYAIPLIRKKLLERRYIHPKMTKSDVTIWQIKMQEAPPSGNFVVTMTSEKEHVRLTDYLWSVGVDITEASDAVKSYFVRQVRRFVVPIWTGDFASYPENVSSYKALSDYLTQSRKYIADFPFEESPQVVMFRGAAVSPPELQFIGGYLVTVPPPTALMWEWRVKDSASVIERHTRIFGFASGAPDDKELCAEIMRNITLRPIVKCDFAFLEYDPIRDVFFIKPYNQPIIAIGIAQRGETLTHVEYKHGAPQNIVNTTTTSPFGESKYASNIQLVSNGGRGAGVYLWEKFLFAAHNLNLRDNTDPRILEQLRDYIQNNVLPYTVLDYRDVDMFLRRLFSNPFVVCDAFSGNAYERVWLPLLGIRGLLLKKEDDKAPPLWVIGEANQPLNTYPFVLIDSKDSNLLVVTEDGIKVANVGVVTLDSAQGNIIKPKVYRVWLDAAARADVVLVVQKDAISHSKKFIDVQSLLYHSLLTPSRLRAALYLVWDTRDFKQNSTVVVKDSKKYAYLLSSLCSYAPLVFANIPQSEELHLFYPMDARDFLVSVPYRARPHGGLYQQANLPFTKERIQLHDRITERWVIDVFTGDGSFLVAYPIPPHQRATKDGKGVPLPCDEFILQAMPLWLLNCQDIPPDGALASAAYTWSSGGHRSTMRLLRFAPKISYTFSPRMVTTEDVQHTLDILTIPDRIVVPKLEKPYPPAKLQRPDETEEWLYLPQSERAEFWDIVLCGGQGYCIGMFPYNRKENKYTIPPRYEDTTNFPIHKTLHMNFRAEEELWFNGARDLGDGQEGAFLRLEPRHPYHWRIYLNLFLPHPILPKAYLRATKDKITFMHMEEEPLYIFGLVKWNTPPSPEYYANYQYNYGQGRGCNLIREWDRTVNGLPTLRTLAERVNVFLQFLTALRNMLTYNASYDDFLDATEQGVYERLVQYYTQDIMRLDYAPVAAYYAPARWDNDTIKKLYMQHEPLGWDERTPACLLVIPYPHKMLEVGNVWGYASDTMWSQTAGISLVAPTPTAAAPTLGGLDYPTAYFFLQEHLRFIRNQNNKWIINFYTFMPHGASLEGLALRPHYQDNINKIRAGLDIMKWSPLFSSVFIYPHYPSIWELHQSVKDALALGMWRFARIIFLDKPSLVNFNAYASLSFQPYAHAVAAHVAVYKALQESGNNRISFMQKLNAPPQTLALTMLYPNPIVPTLLLQPTTVRDGKRNLTLLEVYLRGRSVKDIVNTLVGNSTEILFPLCTPLGGYFARTIVPAPPHPAAAFTSTLFLKPDFHKFLFTAEKIAAPLRMPNWGMEISANVTHGDTTLVNVFHTATYADCDHITIPFAGGIFSCAYMALLGMLKQSQTYPSALQRLFCGMHWLIPYDGGLIFKAAKNLTLANHQMGIFSLERSILLPAFPYGVPAQQGGSDDSGENGSDGGQLTGKKRTWLWTPQMTGLKQKWAYYELPPYSLAAANYPLSPYIVMLAGNSDTRRLPALLEQVLRVCPQRELKFYMWGDFLRKIWLATSRTPHLRAPHTGWLVGIQTLISHMEANIPTNGAVSSITWWDAYSDLSYLDHFLSSTTEFWLFALNLAVNLSLTLDAQKDAETQEP